ncbi:hypothetical protein PLESTB_000776900 [Pleodorina starrii]|uniref:Uncharacterized protein n=1 Tax=Pleodorina starrii TaxID=330485 RepID=A0A9W6BLD5_9CHLO|nr:hypothetical protein PLESTB_000776900 [Pleodorina starrii]GLC72875.1 hypothetical protein PLESTF_001304800 [Pleodorina starrii]
MANLLHRQMLHSSVKCPSRLEIQMYMRAPSPVVGRPFHHVGNAQHRAARTRARDSSENTATSATARKENELEASTSKSSSTISGSSSSKPRGEDEDEDDDIPSLELATTTSFIEKVAGALVTYGLTVLLASFSGVDATTGLVWDGGAPLAVGAAAAAPVILAIGLLFLPALNTGFSQQELVTVGEVDQEIEGEGIAVVALRTEEWPPFTPEALKQGLWLYQMNVLKPWYPAFQWSSVGMLYLASCTASFAQELFLRGYAGSILQGWYTGVLAGTTDVNNPIYWAKVFKLVTPDTARWMAAFSLIALQVALSSSSASRAARFARVALNRTRRVASTPGVGGMVVQRVTVTLDPSDAGAGVKPLVEEEGAVVLPVPTAEERVVYWANLGVSMLLCGSANVAWAASGSLLGSFTAQVVIDGVVTALQQYKGSQLPEKELWDAVQKQLAEKDSDSDSDSDS